MFTHYFTTAIRNIKKNKLSFFINLIGLSLGLASAFIISSYVLKETDYDSFHTKKDRIFRVLCDQTNVGWTSPGNPYVLKQHIDNSIPAVEQSCLTDFLYMAKVKQGQEFVNFKRMHSCTPEFFNIFDCKLISGDLSNALKSRNSLVLTQTSVEKYFPNENPIGKTLEIKRGHEIYQLVVDAVIEDFPKNSSFRFNALCNFNITIKKFEDQDWASNFKTDWHLNFNRMFVLLKNKNPKTFQTTWDQFEKENNIAEQEMHFHLQALTDIHLNSENIVNDGGHGNKTYIYLFSSIAFVILLVAAFNYIILSISISKTRYKEIGIKKILGCKGSLIRNQFLIESILLSVFAFPIAYLLAYWSVDFLNQLFNISLEINIFKKPDQLLAFLFLLLIIGIMSGSYIAFYLSRLKPLDIIKSKLIKQNKKIRFQYVMILIQIIVFTGLTGASFSIYKQIDFLKNVDLGINLKNKIYISCDDLELNPSSYQSLCKIISDIPEVKNYTLSYLLPPDDSKSVLTANDPADETKKITYESEGVTYSFFDFYNIQCTQGRVFNPEFKDDSSKIILNESAVKLFGFTNPIGEFIKKQEIIGVVKDFHLHSLHEGIAPTSFSLVDPKYIYEIAVEYQEGLEDVCSEKLKHELSTYIPDVQIEIRPVEAIIDDAYSEESNLNKIIVFFSLFAIIIALFGLFGQSLFAVKQQLKEIGIRKVNGATNKNIILLILKKYGLLCIIANAISWPIIYVFMEKWQEGFVYKSPINFWLILFTFAASIIVIIGTVISNVLKAARTNPVEVLKYE